MDWYTNNITLIQSTITGFLLALSIQFPLRVGVFSFAGVGSYAIGAYGAGIATLRLETPALVSIAIGAAVAAAVGYALSLVLVRLAGMYLAMATVSFDLIISVVVSNGGDLTGGPTGLFGVLADLSVPQMLAITLLVVAFLAYSERGRFGRRIEVVAEDPELAASMGVDVRQLRRFAFVVSGALGGLAGAMTMIIRTAVGPTDIGFGLVVLALTMIVVGGRRSWVGALIGAVIFTWLPSVLESVGEFQHVVYGVIVAVAAVWLPGGILGVVTGIRRRMAARRREASPPAAVVADDAPAVGETEALAALSGDSRTGTSP